LRDNQGVSNKETLQQIVAEKDGRIAELEQCLAQLQRDNERLSQQIQVLLNRIYRRKSERIDPRQLLLFDLGPDQCAVDDTEAQEEDESRRPSRKAKPRNGHGRRRFPAHLPRQKILLDLPEDERVCPDCREVMQEFGQDVTERGHVIPAQILVRQYVRPKYACPAGHAVRMKDLPPTVIDKGKYEPSVYAQIAVSKFGDHLPLNRQQAIFSRYGIDLPRSTMWDMLAQMVRLGVKPILEQCRKELLESVYIQADETPIVVLIEDETERPKRKKGKRVRKTGYATVYRSGKKVLFQFTLSRSREGPIEFLGSWKGILQTDGYSGYNEITRRNGLIRAGCWTHVRRKYREAFEGGARGAAELLSLIRRLYWIEAALKKRAARRDLNTETFHNLRRDVRQRRSKPVVRRIFAMAQELSLKRSTLPKSPLGLAIGYLQNQSKELSVFLDEGTIEIDNNAAEQAIRPIALGRKNWLHVGSPRGGEVACCLYSLITTCKALDLNPQAYLEDILIAAATTPTSQLASLTPWAWAERQAEKAHPRSQDSL
jgi:transposase/uncharacterized coiled-coil protein SlyX